MTSRMAIGWTVFWFVTAAVFCGAVAVVRGPDDGLAFATAYLLEQALSVDNLVVMMAVFAQFGVPRMAQRRVLTWGIGGVVILRGAMIASGTELVSRVHVLTYVLGVGLMVAAWRLVRGLGEPAIVPVGPGVDGSRWRRWIGRVLPITGDFVGSRFTVVRDGVRHATPLLLAVVTIELADAVFALDSVPAVLGVTTDRFVAFSSNLFAVLGLRAMYFVIADLLARLRYLAHGLSAVLAIVGVKMVVAVVWPMPTWLSLVLVASILAAAIAASLITSHRQERSC